MIEIVTVARKAAERVTDPELPMLTLSDLGVLRDVTVDRSGKVVVTITPTYTGCPAMDVMRVDLHRSLRAAGFDDIQVATELSPPWTTDWISEEGKRKLAEAGIAPPNRASSRGDGPVPLRLTPLAHDVDCPRCGSHDTVELSSFSATACKSLRSCRSCDEPFEAIKEL